MSENKKGFNTSPFTVFLVDFLGGLLPGLLFIFFTFITVIIPFWLLARIYVEILPLTAEFLGHLINVGKSFQFELVSFVLVISYVFGHIFFRQNPKTPDEASYNMVKENIKDPKSWVVQEDNEGNIDIEFPYRFLFEYLNHRNLTHLSSFIPWKGRKKNTHKFRTKTFINILKVRLYFYFPEQVGQIRRNEAHVRLMTSIWYVTRAVKKLSIRIGVPIGIVSLLIALITNLDYQLLSLSFSSDFTKGLFALFISITVFFVFKWMKIKVEEFIHYQRVREIVYVLETAYIASKTNPEILDGLNQNQI